MEKGLSVLEGREISIPVDYDMKFFILKGGKKGEALTASEIRAAKKVRLGSQ